MGKGLIDETTIEVTEYLLSQPWFYEEKKPKVDMWPIYISRMHVGEMFISSLEESGCYTVTDVCLICKHDNSKDHLSGTCNDCPCLNCPHNKSL